MAPLPTIADSLTTNEALVDLFMERAIDLLRLEAGTRNRVIGLLADLEIEISDAIIRIDPNGPTTKRYQRERLEKLLKMVTASIRATYRTADTLLARELRELIDVEYTWTGNAFNAAMRVEFIDAGITRGLLDTLVSDVLIQGAPTKEWWGRQAAGLANRFADEMRRGMTIGETNAELVTRLRGVSGLGQMARTSAERLVRASVQTAANVAREKMYDDNDDIISSVDWSSTLDTRTSPWCFVRDGLRYTPKEHRPIGHKVPWLEGPGKLHWGCRSTSIPRLKTWRELGIDEDEVPETTRASMDGQVPAVMNFESWIEKQSRERQDKVIGAAKADLWRRGKITFRDMLDQNGRPVTVEELRRKAA